MNTNIKKSISVLVAASMLLSPISSMAADLVLSPAYISGQVTVEGAALSQYQLQAIPVKNGSNGTLTSTDPNYTLTVGVPEGGEETFRIQAQIWTDANKNRMAIYPGEITVAEGATAPFDLHVTPAIVEGTVTVSGQAPKTGTLYVRALNKVWEGLGTIDNQGHFRFPTNIEGEKTINGVVTLTNGDQITIPYQPITVTLGQTTHVDLAIDLAAATGKVSGAINLHDNQDGSILSTLNQINVFMSDSDGSQKSRVLSGGKTAYSFDTLVPGSWSFLPRIQLRMNGVDDYLQVPDRFTDPSVYVTAGSDIQRDIDVDLAQISGRITFSGSKEWSDITSAQAQFYGHSWWDQSQATAQNYGGYSVDQVNRATGEYDAIVTAGDWHTMRFAFRFQNTQVSDPADYLLSDLDYRDYSLSQILSLEPGQVVSGRDFNIQTGTVRINVSVADGSDVSTPQITGTCIKSNYRNEPFGYAYIVARGSPLPVKNGVVTIVAPPSPCTFTVNAIVGGALVKFGVVSLEVQAGTDVVVDVGGPELAVNSPAPESYTTAGSLAVTGTVNDDTGVAELRVNGIAAALTSTGNTAKPNEMTFSATIPLVGGPNTIETVAVDASGKQSSDKRVIYRDAEAPTLSWSPTNGASLADSAVVISGTATDDNAITSVKVNGADVSFASSNNPIDPNEVAFSVTLNLPLGTHQIVVSATDNSKRSTSETHSVERVDNRAPVAVAGDDRSLECVGPTTPVAMSGLDSYDPDGDALSYLWSGQFGLISDAQTTLNLGVAAHLVKLTVTDSKNATSSDTVTVSVVDTTLPELTVDGGPRLEIEATSAGETPYTLTANASDKCGNATLSFLPQLTAYPFGDTTVEVKARDEHNNAVSKLVTVAVVDTTPPAIQTAADAFVAARSDQTSVQLTAPTATDLFEPVTVTSNAPATFPIGASTVTWTATDANGNSATSTQKVFVQYAFGGFQSPLKDGGIYKIGRVIPVKILLTYADGTPVVTATPTLQVFQMTQGEVSGEALDISSVSAADSGNVLRYTGSDGEYIFNLNTAFAAKGSYRLIVDLHDSSPARFIDVSFK